MMFISLKSTILDGRTDLYLSSSFPNSKEVLSHFGSSTYKILSSSNNLLERIDRLNMNDGNEELLNLRGVRRVFRARDPREIEEPLCMFKENNNNLSILVLNNIFNICF